MKRLVIDRSIPPEYSDRNRDLELTGLKMLFKNKWEKAANQFREQYLLLLDAESEMGYAIHKGAPLYNWGMALYAGGNELEGLKKIVSALVEDLISEESERIAKAPAWKFLLSRGVPNQDLGGIEELVAGSIRTKEDALCTDAVVHSLFERLLKYLEREPKGAVPARDLLGLHGISLSGSFGNRVFVGGSYKNIALLRHACDIVGKVHNGKYMPILVAAVTSRKKIADRDIHDLCMAILDRCQYAAFDVSISDGALMEIEHCHEIRRRTPGAIEVILLWQSMKKSEKERPPISSMLMTEGFDKRGYTDLIDLHKEIDKFLK